MEKTIIPATIWQGKFFRSAKASTEEKILYLYLVSCERNNFLGLYYAPVEHIAYDLAMDVNSVKVFINKLAAEGLVKYDIETDYIFIPWSFMQNELRPSQYARARKILEATPSKSLAGEIKRQMMSKHKEETSAFKEFLQSLPGEAKAFKQEKLTLLPPEKKKRTTTKRVSKKENEPDEMFEAFWAAYPRKEGKEETRRLFEKMKCSKEEKELFVAAAKKYATECVAKGIDRTYISIPKNFIKSGKCYDYAPNKEKEQTYKSDTDISEVIKNA